MLSKVHPLIWSGYAASCTASAIVFSVLARSDFSWILVLPEAVSVLVMGYAIIYEFQMGKRLLKYSKDAVKTIWPFLFAVVALVVITHNKIHLRCTVL